MPDASLTPIDHLQREVQRKLGRNLLRLQQYEHLAKAMVAEQAISGPATDLSALRDRRIGAVAKKTLGQVVDLTDSCLRPASCAQESKPVEEPDGDDTQFFFSFSQCIQLPEKRFKRITQDLADLVELRNVLVHHFMERHDIWTESGCLAAQAYLDEAFATIDHHHETLRGWAQVMLDTRDCAASFIQSQEFRDLLKYGILPGGAGVAWDASPIVYRLQQSEASLAQDGWTRLTEAIAVLAKDHPDLTPRRYGCRSWRHLLHESGQFEICREQPTPGTPAVTWFRSRGEGLRRCQYLLTLQTPPPAPD